MLSIYSDFIREYHRLSSEIEDRLKYLEKLEKTRIDLNKIIIKNFLKSYCKYNDFNIIKVGFIDAGIDIYGIEYSLKIVSKDDLSVDHLVRIEDYIETELDSLIIKKSLYPNKLSADIRDNESEFYSFGEEIKL